MAAPALLSANHVGLDASSEESLSSAERLFFASSSSPPLRPSYRTPPRVPDGASRRRPENTPSYSHAFASHSSPASSRRFGSPIRLPHQTTTPPRRSRPSEHRSSATLPTRESQLRDRFGPTASAAPLLSLADPVTIVDDGHDAFGGALFGWANFSRPMLTKSPSGLRSSALGELGAIGDGIARSRSTPPQTQQHTRTPPSRPRRPSVASRLVTPPTRVFAQTSARGANGLGLGLGFDLDVEQDSPDTERTDVRAHTDGHTTSRRGSVTRSTSSAGPIGAPALGLGTSPSGLVSTPPKRKTANRTSSTENGSTSSFRPILKSPKKDGASRTSSACTGPIGLAPAFDDGKLSVLEPTGESMFGVPVYRRAGMSTTASPPAARSSAMLKVKIPFAAAASSKTSQGASSRDKANLAAASKAKSTAKASHSRRSSRSSPSAPGLGLFGAGDSVMASPTSTCSAPSLDSSPASTSSVPSIVITPPAAFSLADATRNAFLSRFSLTATPSPQQRYTGTVLQYEDGTRAGFDVSPPLASAAPDQFASPAIDAVSPVETDASFFGERAPSLNPNTAAWFEGHEDEMGADIRAWSSAAECIDSDLLGFLVAAHDAEARAKSDDFIAAMRFRLTLAKNTCPTAPGGANSANSKEKQTLFDCCRWVRGAARAYLQTEPAFCEGKMEQHDLLDAAMAKHMEHIVTGVRALMADTLNGKTPPHETPLWLGELCAAVLSELLKLDEGFAALPLLTSGPQPSEAVIVAPSSDADVVKSLGHLLLGSPANLRGESTSLDTTPEPSCSHSVVPSSTPRKKLSALFLDALFYELDSALAFGAIVREQALHLAVPVPVKKAKRRSSTRAVKGRKRATPAEIDAELAALQMPPSDLCLASKGEISADELRRRERQRAALGHGKESFTTLNNVRFVGELYRLGVLPLSKLQAWFERLIVDTVYPGVPSAFELEATCALVLTVGPILEQQGQSTAVAETSFSHVDAERTTGETSQQEPPETPSPTTEKKAPWSKLTTPGSSESSSSAIGTNRRLSSLKSAVAATPRSDGAPANHWIRCSPFAARLRGRSSLASLRQSTADAADGSEGNDLGRNRTTRSPDPSPFLTSPTPSALASSDVIQLVNAAKHTLDSATSRLEEVLEIEEVSQEGKTWIRGVLGFRRAGWKCPSLEEEGL